MRFPVEQDSIPLRSDPDGVIRIGGTRVTLDVLVAAFENGATPEEIVQQFPSLALGDVYASIAYYLRHRETVAKYLAQREVEAEAAMTDVGRRLDPEGIRARLLARRQSAGS